MSVIQLHETPATTGLDLYTRTAEQSAAAVIAGYSTSFGLATKLLAPPLRPHIRNVYGLVRVADEIVDGAAAAAGLEPWEIRGRLDEFEAETNRAVATGFSTNPIVHAFAVTARAHGIDRRLTAPFFASMRADLELEAPTDAEYREYIHGSAEVVGLMCLAVFLGERDADGRKPAAPDAATREILESGAIRLGAAFQKVNFLRDLAADRELLGRRYLPSADESCPAAEASFGEADKAACLAEIDADLAAAAAAIPLLPKGSRTAVATAHGLFAALADRLRGTSADELLQRRVRVGAAGKVAVLAKARLAPGGSR
ncbi:phytoene/squalene synthase family protein [Agromyces seonyuensis]|uniref:Phytoene/squalene synthase family protein n=1 Tax=Agromyces seonyuensis TaxID=2662446 RepID=A0A6I4P0H4_9MICO|nr:squalene/phytoene synthase family protein [Agromyces seonyuensis]MWB98235.1 phytoene/squalene synthase family protein [Agromyces seonyuensis]